MDWMQAEGATLLGGGRFTRLYGGRKTMNYRVLWECQIRSRAEEYNLITQDCIRANV
jgi:hypothetical protein